MELIGKDDEKGIVWVARRIPDGYVCAHANQARIARFPLDDPENTLYAEDVITFARKKGFFTGEDADFSFCDAYAPLDFSAMRGCEARVWAFFRTVADDMDRYEDYAMGHNPRNPMPLWVKPRAKVSPKQVMDCMRDHYEGTKMNMREDIGAGGHGTPYRWRPMHFEVDGVEYCNERATATQQTGFWLVAQCRPQVPADMGILWFGVDDAATSCLTPIYCSADTVPEYFSTENGSMLKYSDTSAFWLFNRVAQFAYLLYDRVEPVIRKTTDAWENDCLAQIEQMDAKIFTVASPKARRKALTAWSVAKAGELFAKWRQLDRYLLVKFVDGNVKGEDGNGNFVDNGNGVDIPGQIEQPGYNEKWKRAVAADKGEVLKVIK